MPSICAPRAPPPPPSPPVQLLEGEGALRAAAAETAGVARELEDARSQLADRQAQLESARAALGEKDRRVTVLEVRVGRGGRWRGGPRHLAWR